MEAGIIWALFGLIIGSFVNVLIARHGVKSILGRSHCMSCKRTLAWYELVPVLSWVMLRGKCRTCHGRISLQYPAVELATALGFFAIGGSALPLVQQFIGAAIVALLIAIAIYDLYHTLIPDEWSYSFAFLALLFAFTAPYADAWHLTLLAGPFVALPLYLLWRVSGGTWMGLGDAKFALGIGFLLGMLEGYVALSLAFVIGAFVGVFILIPLPIVAATLARAGITRRREARGFTMKSEIPFGPFLICALSIVWFSQLYQLGLVRHLAAFLSWS